MANITTLIFDWHGVLDAVTFESLIKKISNITQLSIDDIKKAIHLEERLYAAGQLEPFLFWNTVQSRFSLTDNQIETVKMYILSCDLNRDLWNYINLQEKYTLAILSDCPPDKLDVIQKKVNLSIFKKTHFSCDEHILKNNDIFFLNLVKELHVQPCECLYIDDSPKHISTAKGLGLQTHLFTKFNALKNIFNS